MSRPTLEPGLAHVWRLVLDDERMATVFRELLSDEERERADRFYTAELRRRYTVAHGWTRHILAEYVGIAPHALRFSEGEFGKPSLANPGAETTFFNLSHSAGLGLLAVSRDGPIGVDVERWDRQSDYLDLAERFFSPSERGELETLARDTSALVAGFFAAWTRKEAYIKATGHGITRGLHHFDVSLVPGAPARLLGDRLNPAATAEWTMAALPIDAGYSAAVVARAPLRDAVVLSAGGMGG
jgi:4'-phosphopantetheinyl transferase